MADTTERVGADIAALRADLDKLRTDLGAVAKTLSGMADAAGTEASERLRATAHSAQVEAERAAAAMQRAVSDQPLVAMVIAFVTGLVLGLLFGRQR